MIRIAIFIIVTFWSINHYWTNMLLLGASAATKKGEYEFATKALTLSIKREPKYFKSYYMRGSLYFLKGDYKNAYKDLLICDYLCPDFGMTRKVLRILAR